MGWAGWQWYMPAAPLAKWPKQAKPAKSNSAGINDSVETGTAVKLPSNSEQGGDLL